MDPRGDERSGRDDDRFVEFSDEESGSGESAGEDRPWHDLGDQLRDERPPHWDERPPHWESTAG